MKCCVLTCVIGSQHLTLSLPLGAAVSQAAVEDNFSFWGRLSGGGNFKVIWRAARVGRV
jgi:hypothetical protein